MPPRPDAEQPTDIDRGDENSPRFFLWFNIIGFIAGILALVILVRHLGPSTMWLGLRALGAGFILSSSFHLASILCDAVTLKASAGTEGAPVPYWAFARASLAGHAVNEATPFGRLGEVTKFAMLSQSLSRRRAAAALIVQNFVMFVVNCALLIAAPLLTLHFFEVASPVDVALAMVAGTFAVLGALSLWFMYRGIGSGPLRFARKLGVSAARVERWTATWERIEDCWHEVVHDSRYMRRAWISGVVSRTGGIFEISTILWFIGVDSELVVLIAAVNLASTQVVGWILTFVPMQAGTSEGTAYVLYSALGVGAASGVLVELVRKLRKLAFIALGVALLGWNEFRQATKRKDTPARPTSPTPPPATS